MYPNGSIDQSGVHIFYVFRIINKNKCIDNVERSVFGTLSYEITALTNAFFPFTGNNLHGLVGNTINKQGKNKLVERKISEKGAVKVRKGFTVFILNDTLIDGITETVKHEITKTRKWISSSFVAPLATSLAQSVISLVVKGTSGRGARRAARGYMDKNF